MDDQKNKPGQNFGDNHGDKRQESPESGSSYYYSYGPFQSYGKNNEGSGEDRFYERRQPEEVEITRPEPVKPLPMYDYRSSGQASGGSNGDGGRGVPTLKSAGNWQYSKPPKKQAFRSVIAGVLAGMLIVTGAMVFADRENLFTSNQAAATTTAPASGTTTEGSGNGSAGKAANVVYPVTSSGDVTSVVNQAGPAVVKIETLTDSSKQSSNSNPYSNDPFYRYFFGDSFGSGRGNSSNG
ncbi:MAG: serine protease, partial [Paenibacillus macerans]|nr:serine protease [Paenibacillus macerans]